MLGTYWEKWTLRRARRSGVAVFVLGAGIAAVVQPLGLTTLALGLFSAAFGHAVYDRMTRKLRRRRTLLTGPFPDEWEAVLQSKVVFFRALDETERERFRNELRVFIGEKRITGIKTVVDTTTLVLTAASAVIPIFGFSEWEWEQIDEVLVYATRFDDEFGMGRGDEHVIQGMVGSGMMNRLMIVSKPALVHGFENSNDKHNVGVHEFAHLLDKADGVIDGVPGVGLSAEAVGPWLELVRRKMQEIEDGESDIRPYGATNEAEFFAVASEYFFERPGLMKKKHPELYAMLARVFEQDLADRVSAMVRARRAIGARLGRNSPCPCGSGEKYKRCCLNAG